MKKLLLVLVSFCSISGITFSQNYIKMIDTSNRWDVLCGGITTNNEDHRQTDKLQFIGDTLINNTIYHKLYSNTHFSINDSLLQFVSALREDTLQKKVYKRAFSGEELIYNFSMQQGDSVIYDDSYGGTHHYVKYYKVDSIIDLYFANKIRKKFCLSDYYYEDSFILAFKKYSWIEGIGEVNILGRILGPVTNLEPFIDRLLCFWQSNQLIYQDSIYQTCLIIPLGIEEIKDNTEMSLSPNPFSQSTQITLNQSYHNISLAVYDIQSKQVAQQQYADCDKIQFSRNQLSNGLYFLKLTLDDKKVETGKIVISE